MSLKTKAVSGAKWAGISQALNQVVQLVIGVLLARLLTPADFGLVGMVYIFSRFVKVLADLGIGAAIVQKEEINDRELSSAFWFNISVGFLLSVLLALVAPLVAKFFEEPRLIAITQVVALTFVIGSFCIVHVSLFVRNFQFRKLAIVESTSFVVAGIIAIVAAIQGCGVWSLVVHAVALVLLKAILATLLSEWRPKFLFSWSSLKTLFPFSLNLSGSQLINYWVRNADNLLIGKFLGTGDLGIYSKAYNFMLMPVRQISTVVSRVMFPSLSSIQNDVSRVKAIYLRTVSAIGLLTFPAGLGLIAISDCFVLGLLGPEWKPMIPILRLLCLLSLTQSIGTLSGTIFKAMGRTEVQLKWTIYASIIYLSGFVIGLQWGIFGVALAYTTTSLTLIFVPNTLVVGRLIGMSLSEFAASIGGVFGCAVCMSAVVFFVSRVFVTDDNHGALLFFLVPFGAVIYTLLVVFFQLKPFLDLKQLLEEVIGKKLGMAYWCGKDTQA